MKLLKSLFAAAALPLALAIGGCAGTSVVELGMKDNGETVRMKLGDSLSLELDGNPTTGYLWVFGAPYDEAILTLTKDEYASKESDGKLVGAPKKRLMVFKSLAPGRTGIKLEYKRPWEKDVKPLKTFELLVYVEGELPKDDAAKENVRRGSSGQIVDDSKNLLK